MNDWVAGNTDVIECYQSKRAEQLVVTVLLLYRAHTCKFMTGCCERQFYSKGGSGSPFYMRCLQGCDCSHKHVHTYK